MGGGGGGKSDSKDCFRSQKQIDCLVLWCQVELCKIIQINIQLFPLGNFVRFCVRSFCLFVCSSVRPSIFVCQSIRPSVHCFFVRFVSFVPLFVCPSVHLSVYASVRLSVWLLRLFYSGRRLMGSWIMISIG